MAWCLPWLALAGPGARAAPEPAAPQGGPAVHLTVGEHAIEVTLGGRPFTTYHFAPKDQGPADAAADPPGGAAPGTALGDDGKLFVRPFFFPVRADDGTEVTSDQLTGGGDHPHHRSLWVAHGDVNGADHWAHTAKPRPPRQRHLRFDKIEADGFVEELEWEAKDYRPGHPVLRERRTARFFGYPDGGRGIDLTLVLTAADGEVIFGDTKEAGLCSVRVAKSISARPTLGNSTGAAGEKACWGKPADWCDESGPIGGKTYGVAILDAPANPRHPATWHAREYGLMTANIFGLHDFDPKNQPKGAGALTLPAGQSLTFRFRVIVHEGDASAAKVAEKYRPFAAEGK